MIRTSGVRTFTCPPAVHHAVMYSVDEEHGTIDNPSRNQLEAEGESTALRGPNKRERFGGYEQPEVTSVDTSGDTSEDTMASADPEVSSSAASLVVTTPDGSSRISNDNYWLGTCHYR